MTGFGPTSVGAAKGVGADAGAKSPQAAKVQEKPGQGGGITNPLRGRWDGENE
jgi:hypothetical protein